MYIILSKKRSFRNVMFWMNGDYGYTPNLANAKIFCLAELKKINYELDDFDLIPLKLRDKPSEIGLTLENVLYSLYFFEEHNKSNIVECVINVDNEYSGEMIINIIRNLEFNGDFTK